MLDVIFYTKENCSLCDEAEALLLMLQHDYSFIIDKRDIYTNDAWLEKYQLLIPFVKIKNTTIDCEQMSLEVLEETIKTYLN